VLLCEEVARLADDTRLDDGGADPSVVFVMALDVSDEVTWELAGCELDECPASPGLSVFGDEDEHPAAKIAHRLRTGLLISPCCGAEARRSTYADVNAPARRPGTVVRRTSEPVGGALNPTVAWAEKKRRAAGHAAARGRTDPAGFRV
jgi:hypothetical protein